jgi:hypothetical protein
VRPSCWEALCFRCLFHGSFTGVKATHLNLPGNVVVQVPRTSSKPPGHLGFWKIVGWIFLVWALLASGMFIFVAIWWGIREGIRESKRHPDPFVLPGQATDDDVLAAGIIGYQWGKHS